MRSSANAVEELISFLSDHYGSPVRIGRGQLLVFGSRIACAIHYSKLLRGEKFFFGVSNEFLKTQSAAFVMLICGTKDNTLVLPRSLVIEMLSDVPSRRLDIFLEDGRFVLQTARHSKRDVSEFLNQWPLGETCEKQSKSTAGPETSRDHVRIQHALIQLGNAEGCSVWVPASDRCLSFSGQRFVEITLERLPNFGFSEVSRRVIQNVDVLWLNKNVIRKAFEIEATTSLYSGLLRLNDLVLSQPNSSIELFIAAAHSRRQQVRTQLLRPSFEELSTICRFISFEHIDQEMQVIRNLRPGVQVKNLICGERLV